MNLTCSWKAFKRYHKDGGRIPSATEFADITAYNMVREAETWKDAQSNAPDTVNITNKERSTSPLLCLLYYGEHVQVILQAKKQVRYVCWSRVS